MAYKLPANHERIKTTPKKRKQKQKQNKRAHTITIKLSVHASMEMNNGLQVLGIIHRLKQKQRTHASHDITMLTITAIKAN